MSRSQQYLLILAGIHSQFSCGSEGFQETTRWLPHMIPGGAQLKITTIWGSCGSDEIVLYPHCGHEYTNLFMC